MSNMSWDDQRIFYAVLEAGSLSGAARKLGLSHPTVRARIEKLERDLETVLFIRSITGVAPTDVAITLGDTVRKMVLASELFVRQAAAVHGEIAGTVRVSVSDVMGLEVIPPMLVTLHEKHPSLKIELVLSNKQANVLQHEVDIAVRNAVPRQQALLARRVRQVPIGFFAAHTYAARRGLPVRFEDIFSHDLVGPDRDQTDLAMVETLDSQFLKCFVLRTDSQPAQMAAARAVLGIGAFQIPLGEADPRLVRVLPDFIIGNMDVWLVTHENLAKTPGVRAVLDHLASEFGK